MTTCNDDPPPDYESLNRSFYQENGPGDFLIVRLYALCIVGGCYERFKDILADGVDFASCHVGLRPTEDDDLDESLEQSDEEFRQHFLRIETHHLKHLAIETLLRMFLAHRGFPPCPVAWDIVLYGLQEVQEDRARCHCRSRASPSAICGAGCAPRAFQ